MVPSRVITWQSVFYADNLCLQFGTRSGHQSLPGLKPLENMIVFVKDIIESYDLNKVSRGRRKYEN